MTAKFEFLNIPVIGTIHSEIKQRYESPRQGVLAGEHTSVIQLAGGFNFQQALKDLDGFERIWVVFHFHLNTNWNPMVTPPRHTRKKVGVFATRSPHRPSGIGISCVKLLKIDGLKLYITESDILDGSPVLDIKPYLPYSDSFPDVSTGWVKTRDDEPRYSLNFSDEAQEHMKWLKKEGGINLKSFVKLQLEFNPDDTWRKRITPSKSGNDALVLAYRTWRIEYSVNKETLSVEVTRVFSGYSAQELQADADDEYNDKALHNQFLAVFGGRDKMI